jgi:hypothetical protein
VKPASERLLQALQRAVDAQRAAREALDDLASEIAPNGLNEQQEELLAEEVATLELGDPVRDGLTPRPASMQDLKSLLNTLYWVRP